MAIRNLPGLGLEAGYPSGYQGWGDGYNAGFSELSAIVQLAVIDRVAAEPGSPSQGDIYLLTATANINRIAVYDEGAWGYFAPNEGWLCYVRDEDVYYVFNGTAWVVLSTTLTGAFQPLDADLTAIAALTTAAYGRSLLTAAADAAARTLLGLGDMSVQSAGAVAITGGTITGITDLAVADGGTGSSTAAGARANLGAVNIAGDIMTGSLSINVAGGGASQLTVTGESTTSIQSIRISNDTTGPTLGSSKAAGTIGAPAVVLANSQVLRLLANAYSGAAFVNCVSINGIVTAAAPGPTDLESTITDFACGPGSASLSQLLRRSVAAGLEYRGNVFLDLNRLFQFRVMTLGTLSTGAQGKALYASDLGGGAGPLHHDGVGYNRFANDGYAAVTTNADFTLTYLADAGNIRHTGTLTANRAITLSTTNARPGARFRVTRTGGGAFNLTFAGKALVTNTWAEAVYDGAAWYLTAYGAL